MTSRTPVGFLVLALSALIVVGCSAPTSAVFQALLQPATSAVASPGAASGGVASDTAVWWQHPDGYELTLPADWTGVAIGAGQTDDLVDALGDTLPGLADRIEGVLAEDTTRVSAVAFARDADGVVSPSLVILAEPSDGRRPHAIKKDVRERIAALPGLAGPLAPHDVTLPTAKAERYDFTLVDPDIDAEVRVRSFLFRYGRTVYLVSFLASAEVAEDAGVIFDDITDSLRFGV